MKHLFTFALLIASLSLFGQKKIVWFDVGLKGQYGAAGLYNKALADDSKYGYTIGSGYAYGGKLGVNFGFNGLSIDVMRSTGKQVFDKTPKTIEWEALDVYTLFRNAKNLGYFEIGPKFSFVNKVTLNADNVTTDQPKENFNKNQVSGVVGFGANILGNDGRFSGILGLRFEYAFTDLDSDTGKSLGAPVNDPSIYANGNKSSNLAFAGVVFELNWGVGYFGKARCGARSKFIMF